MKATTELEIEFSCLPLSLTIKSPHAVTHYLIPFFLKVTHIKTLFQTVRH